MKSQLEMRVVDGEGVEGQRLSQRPEGYDAMNAVFREVRARARCAHHDRGSWRIPGNSLVEIDCIACL
jgi:hypothetical protein